MKKKSGLLLNAFRHGVLIGIGAFFLAIIASFFSQTFLESITSFFAGFIFLIIVILVGVVFDIIGIAAAAAEETPLNACSANKVFGSAQAIKMVKNADRVASFCNDVVGDICGTLSGAIGAALILTLLIDPSHTVSIVAGAIMTAFVASLTVAGKAFGKTLAISKGTEIILYVGKILAWLENTYIFKFLKISPLNTKKGRRR